MLEILIIISRRVSLWATALRTDCPLNTIDGCKGLLIYYVVVLLLFYFKPVIYRTLGQFCYNSDGKLAIKMHNLSKNYIWYYCVVCFYKEYFKLSLLICLPIDDMSNLFNILTKFVVFSWHLCASIVLNSWLIFFLSNNNCILAPRIVCWKHMWQKDHFVITYTIYWYSMINCELKRSD